MKVIDILLEAEVPGGLSGKLARLILPAAARTWNAEKQAAFREAVTALEDTLYLARSQPTPIATSQIDAYKVIQKAAPAHVADVEFSQAVFKAAEERVAQRLSGEEAAAFKPKEEPKPAEAKRKTADTAATEETANVAAKAESGAMTLFKYGVWAAASADFIFNALRTYLNSQSVFLQRTKLPKTDPNYLKPEDAKKADNQQKMILVANLASVVVFPIVASKILSWSAKVSDRLLVAIKLKDPPPLVFRPMKDGTFKQITKADLTFNSTSPTIITLWAAWLTILNSSDPIAGTSSWAIYDENGNQSGTVGAARTAAKLPPDLTPKEIVAYYAINKLWGVDLIQWLSDFFNTVWHTVLPAAIEERLPDAVRYTQKQEIDKAAGNPVTPNEFAKPPKKEKIGNTTWHGDWQD